MWLKSAKPLSESLLRKAGSKITVPLSSSTKPLCLGMPNFVGKSVLIFAIVFIISPKQNRPIYSGEKLLLFERKERISVFVDINGLLDDVIA